MGPALMAFPTNTVVRPCDLEPIDIERLKFPGAHIVVCPECGYATVCCCIDGLASAHHSPAWDASWMSLNLDEGCAWDRVHMHPDPDPPLT